METPVIHTPRLVLRMPPPEEASAVVAFYTENRDHLQPSGPTWPDDFLTLDNWRNQLQKQLEEFDSGLSLRLFLHERTNGLAWSNQVVGMVNFNGIMRRAAQFAYLGYGLAKDKEGMGYMSEALSHAIEFAFKEMNLHRIMANYMPHNVRSARVLRRLGFTVEGFARDYLFLDGKWEDHILTSLTNLAWDQTRA